MGGIGSFGINPTKVYGNTTTGPSIQEHIVGDIGWDRRGAWRFCQFGSAITQYDAVVYGNAIGTTVNLATAQSATTALVSTGPANIGIAQGTFSSGDYGWVWIGCGGGLGSGVKVRVLVSCVYGVKLYTTATAGCLDDSVTAGLIAGLSICVTEPGSGTASIECQATGFIGSNLNAA